MRNENIKGHLAERNALDAFNLLRGGADLSRDDMKAIARGTYKEREYKGYRYKKGGTLLHYLAKNDSVNNGELDLILSLIGSDIDAIDMYGCTALHYVAERHKTDMYDKIVQKGGRKDIKNAKGETADDLAKKAMNLRRNQSRVSEDRGMVGSERKHQLLRKGIDAFASRAIPVSSSSSAAAGAAYGFGLVHSYATHPVPSCYGGLPAMAYRASSAMFGNSSSSAAVGSVYGSSVGYPILLPVPSHQANEEIYHPHIVAAAALLEIGTRGVTPKRESLLKFFEEEIQAFKIFETSSSSKDLNIKQKQSSEQDLAEVSRLLGARVDINEVDESGRTALHYAAARGDLPMVKLLRDLGANLDQANRKGNTPLHLASIFSKNPAVIYALAESRFDKKGDEVKGADIDLFNSNGRNPLLIALMNRNESAIKALLSCGADIDKQDAKGRTVMHYMVANNDVGNIRNLLRCGPDLSIKDYRGNIAINVTDDEQLRSYLKAAEGSRKRRAEETEEYVNKHYLQVSKQLQGGGDSRTLFEKFNDARDIQDVTGMVLFLGGYRREDVYKSRDEHGRSMLHFAALKGNSLLVKCLLSNEFQGCVNERDRAGYTALHYAAKNGILPMVESLLAKGADPMVKTRMKAIPIDLAAVMGHKEVFNHLKKVMGFNMTIEDAKGYVKDELPEVYKLQGSVEEVIDIVSRDGKRVSFAVAEEGRNRFDADKELPEAKRSCRDDGRLR